MDETERHLQKLSPFCSDLPVSKTNIYNIRENIDHGKCSTSSINKHKLMTIYLLVTIAIEINMIVAPWGWKSELGVPCVVLPAITPCKVPKHLKSATFDHH